MLTSHKNSLLINVAHKQWLERLAQSMLKFDRLLLGFIELDKFHLSRCTVLTVIIKLRHAELLQNITCFNHTNTITSSRLAWLS